MRLWARALRPNRPELVGVTVICATALASLVVLIARLAAFAIPVDCFAISHLEDAACLLHAGDQRAYLDLVSTGAPIAFLGLAALAPFVGGIVGLSLVGKDLEQGTAEFAWSIAPSRRRWLAARVIPVCLAILILGGAAGFLTDLLEGQRQPAIDAQRSFEDMGVRGPVIATLALSALGIALSVGAIVGRVLPAFLLSLVLVGVGQLGVRLASDAILNADSIVVVANDELGPGLRIEYLIRTPDGEIITYQEAYERYGSAAVDGLDPAFGLTQMVRWVPGEVYPLASWRLALLYGVVGAVALTISFAVVDRKRP